MDITVALNAAGDGVEAVVLLPGITSANEVTVEVIGDDTLLVQDAAGQVSQVALPLSVDPDSARVRFRRATGKLTFTATAKRRNPEYHAAAACICQEATSTPESACGASPAPSTAAPATAACMPTCSTEESPKSPMQAEVPDAATPNASGAAVTAAYGDPIPEQTSPKDSPAAHLCHQQEQKPDEDRILNPGAAPAAAAAAPPPPPPCPPRSPGGDSVASASADDAALYAEFYGEFNSPPPPPLQPPPPSLSGLSPPPPTATEAASESSGGSAAAAAAASTDDPSSVNAAKVAAAFTPTGGTASRDSGFSFTAPDLPPPPPLPPGLPPVAPPIDCRYLAIANKLRVSAHAPTAAMAELLGLRQRPSQAAERRKVERVDQILQKVADTLDAYGYAVLDNYISDDVVHAARQELRVMEPHYSPGMIWVGKESEAGAQISVSAVRGDIVLWLDDNALGATAFVKEGVRRPCSFIQLQQLLADVDELIFEGLRPRLPYLVGLHRRSDAMMALYPGKGSRFARHVDNTTGDGRRITVVTYMNPGWREEQGGALRLFPTRQGTAGVVDVLPLAGRVAMFLTSEVAHEVMPAFAPRHAVTLWYFDAGEHAAALAAARVMPGATSRPSAQAAATALLRDLLADEAASGIPETTDGCTALGLRVACLESGAQQLLAAVLGLPSSNALVETMRNLTPESLRQRREELRNMGLGTQHHAPDTSVHV